MMDTPRRTGTAAIEAWLPGNPEDEAAIKVITQRFLAVNRARLARLQRALTPRQQPFLAVLPLLFHTNHPMMPGFVSSDTPCGMAGYTPTKSALAAAARLAGRFEHKGVTPWRADLKALYITGSAGTIAYTEASDLDIWLCHRPEIPAPALTNLRHKADRIAAWAASLGLETHFFLTTAENVREGRHEALSTESSGTAQHHLLLDEFYRTALLVAGNHPLWWLVPPDEEHRYWAYTQALLDQNLVSREEVTDFGGLSDIPASEFFGAALWQLSKGIRSPHKSLLKILLLEAYASEFPTIALLSQQHKRAIYEGETRLERLDPYGLMMEKVETYLGRCRDQERLELARRSFYFKTDLRLSRGSRQRHCGTEEGELWVLAARWGWDNDHLGALDNRTHWTLQQILEERRLLVNALTRSYRSLSGFVRAQRELASISQEDLNILGHRLFAAFERKAGKVELITQRLGRDISQENLTISRHQREDQETWLLHGRRQSMGPGTVSRASDGQGADPPLKRARSLVEVLAWCHFNGVAGQHTHFTIALEDGDLSSPEIGALLRALQMHFPASDPVVPSTKALAQASRPIRAALFVNAGVDPHAELTRRGRRLTTDRVDPLNFGSQQDNLARTFDYVFVTSWQEVFAFRFQGMDGLIQCLEAQLGHITGGSVPLRTFCFSADRGRTIAHRVQGLFADVIEAFSGSKYRDTTRYILKSGPHYYALGLEDGTPTHRRLGSETELLRFLGKAHSNFSPVAFDKRSLEESPLPAMFRFNRPRTIQFFYRAQGNQAAIYVLDENGSLFQDVVPFHDEISLINHYERFLSAILYRKNASAADHDPITHSRPLEFYVLSDEHDETASPRLLQRSYPPQALAYTQLQVISEVVGETTEFTLYCDGKEFSTLDYGKALFSEVARHILALRDGRSTYPIYITDLDLSGVSAARKTAASSQTIYYLHYKKQLEERLNHALAEIRLRT